MTAVYLKLRHFTAAKNVYAADANGLAAILRGIAIDSGRAHIKNLAPTHFTDNSTGTATAAPYSYVDVPLPSMPGNTVAVANSGETLADFKTAIGDIQNAHAVLGNTMNQVLNAMGMVPVLGVTTGYGETEADGVINFTTAPVAGDTLTINGTVFTFAGPQTETTVLTGVTVVDSETMQDTLQDMVSAINAYEPALPITASLDNAGSAIVITANAAGTAGNAITIASSNVANPASGATLAGGTAAGTIAETIPAMIKAGTAGSGTACADYQTASAALGVLKSNHKKLLHASATIFTALGITPPTDASKGAYTSDFQLYPIEEPVAAFNGTSVLALADATAFYAATANNVATLAAAFNAALTAVAGSALPMTVVAA